MSNRRSAAPTAAPPLRAAVGAGSGCTVVVDGVRLAYDDTGDGVPIVCLHAIGHGAGDFRDLPARLPGRRVVALDWPGQGTSGPDHVPANAARYADLLAGFVDTLALAPFVLVGNSIGGAAALRYAAAHPERVRALVVENAGGLAPTTDAAARLYIGAMVRFFSAGARGAWWFRAAFGLHYRTILQRGAAREQRRRIAASAYEIAPVLRDAWTSFAAHDADIRALVTRVACPVLVAWAARDQAVQLARSMPAITRFPRARVERFPAGHAAHLETPDAFAASLVRFLEETVGVANVSSAPSAPRRVAAI